MLGQLNPASKATKLGKKPHDLSVQPRFWLKLSALLLAVLSVFALFDASAILLYPRLKQTTCQADTILVMGAAQYNGVPSPAFERRLNKALDLYKQGCGSSIIVTGGAQVGDNYSEGLTGAAYLYHHGVPKSALHSEIKSTTSYENLVFSEDLVPDKKLTIVTDDLHAYRASYLANRLGYESESATAFAPHNRLDYGFKELLKLTAYHVGIIR